MSNYTVRRITPSNAGYDTCFYIYHFVPGIAKQVDRMMGKHRCVLGFTSQDRNLFRRYVRRALASLYV